MHDGMQYDPIQGQGQGNEPLKVENPSISKATCISSAIYNGSRQLTADSYTNVYVTAAREYRCSHSNAKQSFYRSFNAVYGKVGRCASEDVIVELLKTKCLPSLLYGIEACPINKSVIRSFE